MQSLKVSAAFQAEILPKQSSLMGNMVPEWLQGQRLSLYVCHYSFLPQQKQTCLSSVKTPDCPWVWLGEYTLCVSCDGLHLVRVYSLSSLCVLETPADPATLLSYKTSKMMTCTHCTGLYIHAWTPCVYTFYLNCCMACFVFALYIAHLEPNTGPIPHNCITKLYNSLESDFDPCQPSKLHR